MSEGKGWKQNLRLHVEGYNTTVNRAVSEMYHTRGKQTLIERPSVTSRREAARGEQSPSPSPQRSTLLITLRCRDPGLCHNKLLFERTRESFARGCKTWSVKSLLYSPESRRSGRW